MQNELSSVELKSILRLRGAEFDALYRGASGVVVPVGATFGWLQLCPGTPLNPLLRVLGLLVWRGKLFADDGQSLVNFVTIFRWKAVRAKVFVGRSLLDHNPAVIIDYSLTSIVARYVQDEIRQVAPSLYLGQAYFGRKRIFRFILQSNQ